MDLLTLRHTGRPTIVRLWQFLLIAAIFAGSNVLTPSPATAACSGVVYPRVRYHCDVVLANNAIITGLSYKNYNEMYEGNGASIAVYFRDSNNNSLYVTTGTSYVYKSITPGTLKAACWNRTTNSITARCDYVDA